MYKIAILGCENSHANAFMKLIKEDEKYQDIEVVGVQSIYPEAAQKLAEEFNVPVLESFDAAVGKVDGLMITARDGKYHYPYAKPYIATGIPMFLDKPITVSEEDAIALVDDLKANNVAVCGGSTLMHAPYLKELKKVIADGEMGEVVSGFFRAPINMVNEYGGFFFYSAHIIAMVTEVFGFYPNSVYATQSEKCVDCIVSYDKVNVHLQYLDGPKSIYYAMVSMQNGIVGSELGTGGYKAEFDRFYSILTGAEAGDDYANLTANVFILNAINRSLESGKTEKIGKLPE